MDRPSGVAGARTGLVPPAPGLVVTQIAPHAFRFDWTLPSSTAHCRPAWIVLRVFGPDKGFGPSDISVTALSGVNVVTVPDYFTVVNAGASSFTASFTVSFTASFTASSTGS